MTELYVVFENGEPAASFPDEGTARDFIDCNCLPDDLGERFEIVLFVYGYTLPNHRSKP